MQRISRLSASRSESNQAKQKRRNSRQCLAAAIETLESRTLLTNVYNVTGFADGTGSVAGSGPFTATTLRAAINAADGASGSSTINLPAGTYTLNSSALGSLSVSANMTISGAGAATTIIDATGLDSSAFNVADGSTLVNTISGVTIENAAPNSTTSLGGSGVSFSGEGPDAVLNLTNDAIEKNTGGWIDAAVTFGAGGGIYAYGGVVNVTGCTISGNSTLSTGSGSGGGGISADFGTVNILASTISGNSAQLGGGIYGSLANSVTVSNSTIASNTATAGAGINLFESACFLASDTIAFNTATGSGGGIVSTQGLPANSGDSIQDCIVAENTGSGAEDDFDAPTGIGAFHSEGYNLIGVANSTFTAVTGDQTGAAGTPLNPDFTSTTVQNNGGSTLTLLPGNGSPAIDKGNNALAVSSNMSGSFALTTDETGNQRIVNTTVDIGAVEVQPAPAANNLVVENNHPSGTGSLAAAVASANSSVSPAFITFDSAVFTTPQTITLGGELELTNTSEPITITGPAAEVTISGGGNSRVFEVDAGVTAEIDDVTITGGKETFAGGIRDDGTLTLTNDIVSHNQAGTGGALGVGGVFTAIDTTFDSNSGGIGGVMYEDGAKTTSTFRKCTFSNNSATTGDGGALFIGSASQPNVNIFNSTFAGNTAKGEGGAIYLTQGSVSLTDSTLSDNTTFESQGAGGAIGVGVVNPTINLITVNSDIIAGNFFNDGNGHTTPDDISTEAVGPSFPVSGGNNLIGTGGSGNLKDGANHNQVGVANPGLEPLGNYGGPTQTMALLPGSPAIGTGLADGQIQTDQRGVSRDGGVLVDIGAYQYSTPGTVTIAAGDVNGLITYLSPDSTTTIDLTKSDYDFTQVNNNWYGPNALPAIVDDVTVDGNGATLERDSGLPQTTAGSFRFFYVSGGITNELPLGTLELENLTLKNGLAKGGDSSSGAGLGAGGAIFNQGSLTLDGVTLSGNEAIGGNSTQTALGVGGGGMGQDATANNSGAGFGGGFQGAAYTTGFHPSNASGGGGAGLSANATGTTGGGQSGLGAGGGDGGIGGSADVSFDPDATTGVGGNLGTGGENALGNGGGGGVGAGGGFGIEGNGGGGGFGGGGSDDADGGFGGRRYYHGNHLGVGGFGGGNSNNKGNVGGGGAGLGGAIFSMYGSVTVINSTLTGNSAIGGTSIFSGEMGAFGGSGYGGAIFNLDGSVSLSLVTDANNTVTAGAGDNGNGSADGGALYNLAYGNNYATGKAVAATVTLSNSILAGTIGGTDDLVDQESDGKASQNTGNSANVTRK